MESPDRVGTELELEACCEGSHPKQPEQRAQWRGENKRVEGTMEREKQVINWSEWDVQSEPGVDLELEAETKCEGGE